MSKFLFIFCFLLFTFQFQQQVFAGVFSSGITTPPISCPLARYAIGGGFEDQLNRVVSYAKEDGVYGYEGFTCTALANRLDALASEAANCRVSISDSDFSYYQSKFQEASGIYNTECPKCRKIKPFGKKACDIKSGTYDENLNSVDLDKCVYKIKCPADYQCWNNCSSTTAFTNLSNCIKNDNNDSNACPFFKEEGGKRKRLDSNKFVSNCFAKGSYNYFFTYDIGPGGSGNILAAVCVGVNSISCDYKDLDTMSISCLSDGLDKSKSKANCENFSGEITENGVWDDSGKCTLTLNNYNYDSAQRDRNKANTSICSYFNYGSFFCNPNPNKKDWKVSVIEPNECLNKGGDATNPSVSGFYGDYYRCVYNKSTPQSTWPKKENVCTYSITISCAKNTDSSEIESRCLAISGGEFNSSDNSCTIKNKNPYGSISIFETSICKSCSDSFLTSAAQDIKTLNTNLIYQADRFKDNFDRLTNCSQKMSILSQQASVLRSILSFIGSRIDILNQYKNNNNLGGACVAKVNDLISQLRDLASSLSTKFNSLIIGHNASCPANQIPTLI